MPANLLTTDAFVKDIKALFKGDKRYKVTILNESEMKKKKMHALLGVGQGSKYRLTWWILSITAVLATMWHWLARCYV